MNGLMAHKNAPWYIAVCGFKPRRIVNLAESLLRAAIDEDQNKEYILIHGPSYEEIEYVEWIADERIGLKVESIKPYMNGYLLVLEEKLP